ncbi:Double-stranded RNA-binding protein 2 [Forsythia ovata]|uniref:Double-stranded RNA-binding protein 2 n=1 Tax=Forsythia ovata TaxID=205694 RepID=A0ABD1RLX2_9LAMI
MRHDILDIDKCMENEIARQHVQNTANCNVDGSSLSAQHLQSTLEASNEVLSESDERKESERGAEMYKNQLQELAQRSCFNLPSYTCIREGPDHAPRFKAIVNFNGETFESPNYCSTLRQAEHSAAEAALNSLSSGGPSHSLAARILDETGVYKNLLQEIAQRVGSPLPQYTTFKSGSGHLPVFTGTVELAGITFTGETAKNKKQAEKNAALAAWLSLKQLEQQDANSSPEQENSDEQEQIRIARALLNYRAKEKLEMANPNRVSIPFQKKFPIPTRQSSSPQRPTAPTSKILPFLCKKSAPRNRPSFTANDSHIPLPHRRPLSQPSSPEVQTIYTLRFPDVGAAPYLPVRQCRAPYQGIAPPVTIRNSVPVFSAPPRPPPSSNPIQPQSMRVSQPVCVRQAVPVYSAPPVHKESPPPKIASAPPNKILVQAEENAKNFTGIVDESTVVKCLEQLEI